MHSTTSRPGEVPLDRGMPGHRICQPPVTGSLTSRPVHSHMHSGHHDRPCDHHEVIRCMICAGHECIHIAPTSRSSSRPPRPRGGGRRGIGRFEALHNRYASFDSYMMCFLINPGGLLTHIAPHRQPARAAAVHYIDVCILTIALV